MKKCLAVFCLFVMICLAPEKNSVEQFTIPSKPKKESQNQIKESIADSLMRNTIATARSIQQKGLLEELLLKQGAQLIAQEKNSFFSQASIAELQEYRKRLDDLEQAQRRHSESLEGTLQYLKKIHAQSAKK